MKLVVVIPALDEEETVSDVIRRIPRDTPSVGEVEVIVVDDGSTDRTAEVAREAGAKVVSHPRNRGLGTAFMTGIDAALMAGADVIVNMDADGQFNPEDIPTLIEPVLSGGADFATCTRFGQKEWIPQMPWAKRWGNRMMCRLVNAIIHQSVRFTDVSCGFRAYSREAALKLNLFGTFTYTQESLIALSSKGLKLVEVPLQVRGEREHGQSRIAHSLAKYARNAGLILVRSMRDLHPLRFFGSIGLGVLVLGVGLGLFVFIHWMRTGHTSPFRSVLLGTGVAIILSFLLFVLALLADMLGTLKKGQDRLLSLMRRQSLVPERPFSPGAQDRDRV